MLVRFTAKGKPTLVNVKHVVGVRKDIDQRSNEVMTKLYLTTGQIIFVDEEMNQVHKMINESYDGVRVETYDYDVPSEQSVRSVDERMSNDYDMHERQRRPYRKPAYSSHQRNSYDDNRGGYRY
jgi:hypothetical protein